MTFKRRQEHKSFGPHVLIYKDMRGQEDPSLPAKATGTFCNQKFWFFSKIPHQPGASLGVFIRDELQGCALC